MDEVCKFNVLNNWAMLNDEYTLLSIEAKDLIASNTTRVQSSAVDVAIERYPYIRNTNPGQYNDFLGLGVSPSPRLVPTDGPNHLGVMALFLLINVGLFYVMTKRKIEH